MSLQLEGREWITSEEGAVLFDFPTRRAFREWARRMGLPSRRRPGSHLRFYDRAAIEGAFHGEHVTHGDARRRMET